MKITTLIENTAIRDDLIAHHGLSLFIETRRHTIVCDTGASDDTWLNAQRLSIDVKKADIAVISHGHYDHAGGLMRFSELAPRAKIYMRRTAFGAFYNGSRNIGVDPAIRDLQALCLTDGDLRIDEELSLFTNIGARFARPAGNAPLMCGGAPDPFTHEQCLVIEEEGRMTLVSGCAHTGIPNILDTCRERYGRLPDTVVSGFHMHKIEPFTDEELDGIRETARMLAGMDTVFYTGHCTDPEAFCVLKEIMGGKLRRISTGTVFGI